MSGCIEREEAAKTAPGGRRIERAARLCTFPRNATTRHAAVHGVRGAVGGSKDIIDTDNCSTGMQRNVFAAIAPIAGERSDRWQNPPMHGLRLHRPGNNRAHAGYPH